MSKFLFSLVVASVIFLAAPVGQAKASWLSQAWHGYVDPGYYNGYYYPGYGSYYYPGSTHPYYQGYTYPYYQGYTSPYYQGYYYNPGYGYPPAYNYPAPSYYGPGYRSYMSDPQWQHDWHEYMEHRYGR